MNDVCRPQDGYLSYILPGSLDDIILTATSQKLILSLPENVNWFIAKEAPVYQLDYLDFPQSFTFSGSDCQVYASPSDALQLCMTNMDETLVAGAAREFKS